MNTENWLPVVGYEGLYEVSDLGRVRRVKSGRILKPVVRGRTGHVCVNLSNGVARLHYIHVLVLEAFVGLRPDGHQSCHFPDRDPRNNALANLRWDTAQNNMLDKTIHGTHPDRRGEKHPTAKLTDDQAAEMIRLVREEGFTQTEVARAAGVHQSVVSRMVNGKRRRHLRDAKDSG